MDTTSKMRELVAHGEKATAIKLESQMESVRLQRLSVRLEARIQRADDEQKVYKAA